MSSFTYLLITSQVLIFGKIILCSFYVDSRIFTYFIKIWRKIGVCVGVVR